MAHRNTGALDATGESVAEAVQIARMQAPAREQGRICVFCGSSIGNKPIYAQAARELGSAIGEEGHMLVFGGGAVGLMGEVARTARSSGAPVIGILPAFLRGIEPPLKSAEELIITPDLQLRKARMLALADVFVILPGGLGTLDEYFEVITTTQLKVHAKPIIVVDIENYFAPLRALLDRIVEQGFARADIAAYHEFVSTPAAAMERIRSLLKACAS